MTSRLHQTHWAGTRVIPDHSLTRRGCPEPPPAQCQHAKTTNTTPTGTSSKRLQGDLRPLSLEQPRQDQTRISLLKASALPPPTLPPLCPRLLLGTPDGTFKICVHCCCKQDPSPCFTPCVSPPHRAPTPHIVGDKTPKPALSDGRGGILSEYTDTRFPPGPGYLPVAGSQGGERVQVAGLQSNFLICLLNILVPGTVKSTKSRFPA